MKTRIAILTLLILVASGCVQATAKLGPNETITFTRATLPNMKTRTDNYSWGQVDENGYVSGNREWNGK